MGNIDSSWRHFGVHQDHRYRCHRLHKHSIKVFYHHYTSIKHFSQITKWRKCYNHTSWDCPFIRKCNIERYIVYSKFFIQSFFMNRIVFFLKQKQQLHSFPRSIQSLSVWTTSSIKWGYSSIQILSAVTLQANLAKEWATLLVDLWLYWTDHLVLLRSKRWISEITAYSSSSGGLLHLAAFNTLKQSPSKVTSPKPNS